MNIKQREFNKNLEQKVTCKKCNIILGVKGNKAKDLEGTTAYKFGNDYYCQNCKVNVTKEEN